MTTRFGTTKKYLFGKVSDTQSGGIRVVRVFDKIVYEKCGDNHRLFKSIKVSSENTPDFIGKLISTILIMVFSPPLFILFMGAFIFHIWKTQPKD